MHCPLCSETSEFRKFENHSRTFFRCGFCDLIFSEPSYTLDPQDEKARYETHNNDIHDPNYQNFVRPLVNWVMESYSNSQRGLDFGAGTGPVVSHLLKQHGYSVDLYDPFFWPKEKGLQENYDFIVSTEVVEHFAEPRKEFLKLHQHLKPHGSLFLMTLLHHEKTEWSQWYYLRDPTHRCAYSKRTFEWIREFLGFNFVEFRGERQVKIS